MIAKFDIIRKLIRKLRRLISGAAGKPQAERKDNGRHEHGVFAI